MGKGFVNANYRIHDIEAKYYADNEDAYDMRMVFVKEKDEKLKLKGYTHWFLLILSHFLSPRLAELICFVSHFDCL